MMGQRTHHIQEPTRRTCIRYQQCVGLQLHFVAGSIQIDLLGKGHPRFLHSPYLARSCFCKYKIYCNSNRYIYIKIFISIIRVISKSTDGIYFVSNVSSHIFCWCSIAYFSILLFNYHEGELIVYPTVIYPCLSIRCHYYSIHQCF